MCVWVCVDCCTADPKSRGCASDSKCYFPSVGYENGCYGRSLSAGGGCREMSSGMGGEEGSGKCPRS
jgi:hypothetical protein